MNPDMHINELVQNEENEILIVLNIGRFNKHRIDLGQIYCKNSEGVANYYPEESLIYTPNQVTINNLEESMNNLSSIDTKRELINTANVFLKNIAIVNTKELNILKDSIKHESKKINILQLKEVILVAKDSFQNALYKYYGFDKHMEIEDY